MRLFRIGPGQAIAAVQQAAEGSKKTLQQVREVADPRTIAAGLVGLTAGEVIGGTIGGLVGVVVAGPAGAAAGGQIGAFTVSMVGLKLGAEAMHGRLHPEQANPATGQDRSVVGFLRKKSGERAGELAGLSTGATLGLVVAGPAGGLIGAVIGEAVGGQLGEDAARRRASSGNSSPDGSPATVSLWIDTLGKTTAGESLTVLAGGTVGSIFGPGGRAMGQRIGIIVGKRVEWHKLGIAGPNGADSSKGAGQGSGVEHDVQILENATPFEIVSLTDRELKALTLYAAGESDEQISEQLRVKPDTARRYVRRICRKLDIETPEQAVALSMIFMPISEDAGDAERSGISA